MGMVDQVLHCNGLGPCAALQQLYLCVYPCVYRRCPRDALCMTPAAFSQRAGESGVGPAYFRYPLASLRGIRSFLSRFTPKPMVRVLTIHAQVVSRRPVDLGLVCNGTQ